ncbi:hypothetical protein FOMPIDRAFT_1049861 [Fomitopsis schrenkii]|uniref:Uncharacterized protein n=1 Tax=Fomitopsis schrenkii TaxID=2126942 RepID=S8EAJ1_FOMSC|nr:hypothetical protein FOMPIDRAFT_1049861 [Fomitopsis schrenkii]
MSVGNPTIPLEANSLYMCLTQLLAGFHWSLFITDAQGKATRHHWSQDSRRRGSSDPVEVYTHSLIDPVTQMTRGMNLNLAFIRVSAFVAPRMPYDYVSLFSTIFPETYTTVRDNRTHGTTCRTWAMGALQKLRENNLITLSTQAVAALEQRFIDIGTEVEAGIASGTVDTAKVTQV